METDAAAECVKRTKTGDKQNFSCAMGNILVLYHAVLWGYGGMVDAEDLKSFGHCDRVGSSPTIPTTKFRYSLCELRNLSAAAECVKRTKTGGQKKPNSFGCVAQLVRALRSHRRGRWFESNHIHHEFSLIKNRHRRFFV